MKLIGFSQNGISKIEIDRFRTDGDRALPGWEFSAGSHTPRKKVAR
jgi:hypothetical protein